MEVSSVSESVKAHQRLSTYQSSTQELTDMQASKILKEQVAVASEVSKVSASSDADIRKSVAYVVEISEAWRAKVEATRS